MNFTKLKIHGVYLIRTQKREDERGSLTRIWCAKEFAENGINVSLLQGYTSTTKHAGTIRGIHCQVEPAAEDKLTRIVKGKIYEVVVDLRKDSPTYLQWEGVTLSADDNTMMFIPSGVGHGFLTLLRPSMRWGSDLMIRHSTLYGQFPLRMFLKKISLGRILNDYCR